MMGSRGLYLQRQPLHRMKVLKGMLLLQIFCQRNVQISALNPIPKSYPQILEKGMDQLRIRKSYIPLKTKSDRNDACTILSFKERCSTEYEFLCDSSIETF